MCYLFISFNFLCIGKLTEPSVEKTAVILQFVNPMNYLYLVFKTSIWLFDVYRSLESLRNSQLQSPNIFPFLLPSSLSLTDPKHQVCRWHPALYCLYRTGTYLELTLDTSDIVHPLDLKAHVLSSSSPPMHSYWVETNIRTSRSCPIICSDTPYTQTFLTSLESAPSHPITLPPLSSPVQHKMIHPLSSYLLSALQVMAALEVSEAQHETVKVFEDYVSCHLSAQVCCAPLLTLLMF